MTDVAANPISPGRVAVGVLRTMRPRQWVKNVVVLAAPFAAGQISHPSVLRAVLVAFVVFCLAASGIYLINDAKDVAADRAHPTKRNRPIAAGIVPVPVAVAVGVLLLLGAVGLSFTQDWQLALVASGFLLRAIAGGVAANLQLSQWFLLTTAFGSLFMVSGKRYAEVQLFERTGAEIRSSLRKYSASYLRFVWATSVAVVIATYGQWAFQLNEQFRSVWAEISIVPFVIALLRYAVDVDGGNAGEPEDIVLRDRVLQILGVCWVVTLGLAFY
jgi:decaprenyl-phosphate phosphoribosyltransferase